MIERSITIHPAPSSGYPSHKATGYAPDLASPLLVAPVFEYDALKEAWVDRGRWRIVHASGWRVGPVTWPTRDDAYAALLKCDPGFYPWSIVQKDEGSDVMKACRAKYDLATEGAARG